MNSNLFENLNNPNLWSPITVINDVEYTPIQIHNMTGYRTPEVEQPSCKFCSEEWLKRELVWDDQSNLEVCNGNVEVELYDPIDEGYSYATFEIKFCPMCGKRLETDQ